MIYVDSFVPAPKTIHLSFAPNESDEITLIIRIDFMELFE